MFNVPPELTFYHPIRNTRGNFWDREPFHIGDGLGMIRASLSPRLHIAISRDSKLLNLIKDIMSSRQFTGSMEHFSRPPEIAGNGVCNPELPHGANQESRPGVANAQMPHTLLDQRAPPPQAQLK